MRISAFTTNQRTKNWEQECYKYLLQEPWNRTFAAFQDISCSKQPRVFQRWMEAGSERGLSLNPASWLDERLLKMRARDEREFGQSSAAVSVRSGIRERGRRERKERGNILSNTEQNDNSDFHRTSRTFWEMAPKQGTIFQCFIGIVYNELVSFYGLWFIN